MSSVEDRATARTRRPTENFVKFERVVFTARRHDSAVYAVVVCLSVTSRCSAEIAKRRITQTTPHDSPGRATVYKAVRRMLSDRCVPTCVCVCLVTLDGSRCHLVQRQASAQATLC